MFVKKYKINNSLLSGGTDYSINLPMSQNGGFVGQQEIVDTKFVKVEVENSINEPYDYEKIKILPKNGVVPIKSIIYNVTFLSASYITHNPPIALTASPPVGFGANLTWENLGLTDNDLKFRKKAFSKSFLKLDFYDSDISTNQNYLSFITLYPKFERFTSNNIILTKYTDEVSFELGNTVINRNKNGEGFSLYYFKDEIFPSPLPPKYLYMRATFNNAKSGKSTGLMSSSVYNLPVDELMKTTKDITTLPVPKNNMYTRYILTRGVDGYFYDIDKTYSNNVSTPSTDIYNVELYEISSI